MTDIWGILIALAFAVAILCAAAILTGKLLWPHIENRIQRVESAYLAKGLCKTCWRLNEPLSFLHLYLREVEPMSTSSIPLDLLVEDARF